MRTNFRACDPADVDSYHAILLLDEGLEQVERQLRDRNFWAFPLSPGLAEEQRQIALAQRVLVTRRPEHHRIAAAEAEASLIDVADLTEEQIAVAIEENWNKLNLGGKFYFLLRLGSGGEGTLEALE